MSEATEPVNPEILAATQPTEPEPEAVQVIEPRHSFYESDGKLSLDIFDKGANPEEIAVKFEPRAFTYENGTTKKLYLQPLKGEIDPEASSFTVKSVKIEVHLVKRAQGRWGALVGDMPDVVSTTFPAPIPSAPPAAEEPVPKPKPRKNWDAVTEEILKAEPKKGPNDDPNAGGDAAVNEFFQSLFAGADPDTRRAMMKSYQESGGTTLSTNWEEVGKGKVEVKPPQGSEWKQWG